MKRQRYSTLTAIPVLLALAALVSLTLAAQPGDSDFQQRIAAGESWYKHDKHDEAIREFRAATRLQPNSSVAWMWLGRALGRKAEKVSPFRAAFMVGDVREAFEKAVRLDPANVDARSDLLDFYLEAPSMFGGGLDKARQQAEAIARLDPAEGHWARARIAEKEKRYPEAAREYRAATEARPQSEGYKKDLQKFLNKHPELSGK